MWPDAMSKCFAEKRAIQQIVIQIRWFYSQTPSKLERSYSWTSSQNINVIQRYVASKASRPQSTDQEPFTQKLWHLWHHRAEWQQGPLIAHKKGNPHIVLVRKKRYPKKSRTNFQEPKLKNTKGQGVRKTNHLFGNEPQHQHDDKWPQDGWIGKSGKVHGKETLNFGWFWKRQLLQKHMENVENPSSSLDVKGE